MSDANHSGIQSLIKSLNSAYKNNACLWDNDHNYSSFEWIDFADADQSVVSFIRYDEARQDSLLCICNLTPITRDHYNVGVPETGTWKVILNTDSAEFNGSNYLKEKSFNTTLGNVQGREQSITINLPPLSVIYLKKK